MASGGDIPDPNKPKPPAFRATDGKKPPKVFKPEAKAKKAK